jgi:hypothetical protein
MRDEAGGSLHLTCSTSVDATLAIHVRFLYLIIHTSSVKGGRNASTR